MEKYEEALERARAGKPIDEVFPELKDEGIRNELYSFISSIQHSYLCANDRREKWLAWLERQKKQKPLSTEETERNSIAFLEQLGYTCIPPGAEQKPAEWSEEDKKFIKHCAELLDGLGEPMCAIRLESLLARSLWKPSEMQLEGGCSEKPNDLLSEQEPTCKDYTHFADVGKMEQPEVDLEKAARNVYKSLNDVHRDMVELGRVLNARKGDSK